MAVMPGGEADGGFALSTTSQDAGGGKPREFRLWADSVDEKGVWVDAIREALRRGPVQLYRGTQVRDKTVI
eukprot:COSAG01_NODE_7268_length_3275_cov_289.503463_2_plen_71_part_00